MNLQNNKLKNFTPLPNEIFSLHLSTGELATYAVLMRLEDPRTYECWPSYETIGKAIGKSKSSVKRYVAGLVEKGLITVEPREASEMFQCIKYEDKREIFGLKIHSFSTLDRIKKYDDSDNEENAEKPYSIKVGETKRTINLYAIATTKFQIAV